MREGLWKNIETLFNRAINLPTEQRFAYLASTCGGDDELIREVLSLIEESENGENFLSEPVFELGTKLLAFDPIGLLKEPDYASYRLLGVLGRGGTGVVFLAEHKDSGRMAAIKILPFSLAEDDERILRFQREAKTASSITHPNFAQIYDFGKAKDRFYIAMEYVPGTTLRQLIKSETIDVITALKISVQVAEGLHAAHRAEISHRDIKPENIIITDDGIVKILDFGLAKMFDSADSKKELDFDDAFETSSGLIIGTVNYMSPEQVRGQPLDGRTDLWSLGVTFYEMLTGERPFTGETPSDVQASILLSDPQYPNQLEKKPAIKQILSKLLCKKVADRYQNAVDLIKDLTVVSTD